MDISVGTESERELKPAFDALTEAMTTQFEQEAKLQLQKQASQHEHELRLFNIFEYFFHWSTLMSCASQHRPLRNATY